MFIPQPAFFDIFGLIVFGFIVIISVWALRTKRQLPRWVLIVLLLVGIGGLIIDVSIVYTIYIR
ncbi:MAG: hypothetical protein HYW77_03240 [Parcubacteria group bacterium]|nr:hypothetical protein [Parcubacteria group bacterium]